MPKVMRKTTLDEASHLATKLHHHLQKQGPKGTALAGHFSTGPGGNESQGWHIVVKARDPASIQHAVPQQFQGVRVLVVQGETAQTGGSA